MDRNKRPNRWRLIVRIGAVLAAAGLLAVAVLLVWVAIARNRTVVLPAPGGPYAVGRVAYDWVDGSRADPFAPGEKRELLVWVWYPAEGASAGRPAEYLPQRWGQAREQDLGVGAWLVQRFDTVQPHAVAAAPLALAGGSYPVLIFSTGYGRLPADYTTLAEELASYGYVVAAIANPYSAPVVVFPDGRLVWRVAAASIPDEPPEASQQAAERLVAVWAADVTFVMDQLAQLNATPPGMFAGHLDLPRLGVLGHSLGGAAAALACLRDNRCQAGVDIDGTLFGDVVPAGVAQPFLFITSEPPSPDTAEQDRRSFASSLGRGAGWITIRGCRHMNFTDLAVTFAPAARVLGLLGPIDGERGLRITADYVRAFFDHALRQIDSPLLQGPAAAYPEVEFHQVP
jgi:predicted dienelactone hydrolase